MSQEGGECAAAHCGDKLARLKAIAARCALAGLFAGAGALPYTDAVAAVPCNPDNIPEPTTTITSPTSGTVFSPAPQNITIRASIGASGTTQRVVYYANGTAIGTATSSPWSVTWAAPAGTYSLQARTTSTAAFCTGTGPMSSVVSIRVNTPPTVSIASPASGTASTAPGSFNFTASAADSDGAISNVQWFANGGAISGALSSAPYAFTWSGAGAGTYSITATATDSNGVVTTSAPISVVSNDAPSVSISPTVVSGTAPASITLQATTSDSLGGVSSVQYFANGSAISGALTAAPYTFSWSGVGAGSYGVTARATDAYGATGTSSAYTFNVNAPPTVSLTTPANGTIISSGVPATIALSAAAADSDGSVTKVEFLVNGSVVGTATSAPYTINWNAASIGTYSVQARATDNIGGVTTSATTQVIVGSGNAAQFVSQNVPIAIGAGQTVPVSVTMKNLGTSTWTSAGNFRLGAQNAQDNTTWGTHRVALPQSVAPGANATFAFNVTAPSTLGSYNFQWKMVQDGVEWFGDLSTNVAVAAEVAPTTSISSPSNGATFLPGWDIPVSATAADSDGSVAKVEIYDGSSLVATLTTAPYTTTMTDVPAGTHVLTAKAYDNQGVATTSVPVSVNVAFNAPPISSGTGMPGKLAGALGVSSGGAAQYTIPIVLPPATAGVAPDIAMKYDSSGGNGIAGMGWSITGLSQISRCARDWAHEGLKAGVDLTTNDRFCLDGQRLIAVNGTYGAAGTEYRTEIDNFTKIVSVGAPGNGSSYFMATLRDGTQLEYGNSTDSKLLLSGLTTPLAWSVNKVTDARTNFYTVTYTTFGTTGQQLISRIDYTGNTAGAKPTYNSVQFAYDQTRNDVETRYILGAAISNTARLTSIKTYAGASFAKEYRFGYEVSTPTARSRIKTVTECGDAGGSTCLPPTTFSWENTPTNFSGPVIDYTDTEFAGLAGGELTTQYWVELNGDGLPDRCIFTRTYYPDTVNPQYEDLLCALTQPGGAAPLVITKHYSGFGVPAGVSFVDLDGNGINNICSTYGCGTGYNGYLFSRFFVDVNGDGKVDQCDISKDPNTSNPWTLTCALASGSGAEFSYGPAITLSSFTGCGGTNGSCSIMQYSWADVSGDGVPSFCRIDNGTMRCRKWTPDGLAPEITVTLDAGEWSGRAWVDINGDGKADFCRVISNTPGQASGTGVLACALATGTGFSDTVRSGTIDIGRGFAPYATRNWVDVNGDGKADYCRGIGVASDGAGLSSSTTDCILSTGVGFGAVVSIPTGTGTAIADPNRDATSISFVAQIVDSNGDGNPDVCFRTQLSGGAMGPARCMTAGGTYPDLLLSVTDGLGARTSVDYRPISDSSVYTKGTGATFPTIDLQDSTHVVQRVRTENGVGGTVDVSYTYEGAKADQQGRGFLGFTATSSTGPTGTTSRTERNTDFPFAGAPKHTVVSNGGVTLSDTSTSYSASTTNGTAPLASYFVYPTSTVAKTYDLNGALISWIESNTPVAYYDVPYGNVLQVDTIYKDPNGDYSRTVQTTYLNDTTNWILGRPTSVVTTSRAPNKPDSVRTLTSSYRSANPGLGLLQQNIVEPNNGGTGATNLRLVTDYAYDTFGNLLAKTVSGANITTRTESTNTYDTQGRGPVTIRNAMGHQETRGYDWRYGVLSSLQGPNGLTTSWTYDLFGRQLTEDLPDGTRSTNSYNVCANCVPGSVFSISRTETVIASGATAAPSSRTYYDTLGRGIVSARTGFAGQDVYRETLYDNLGRVRYASANYFAGDSVIRWTQYDYDPLGRTVLTTAPDNSTTSATYNGRTTSVTNANGVTNSRSIDGLGRVVSITDALGTADASSVAYEYDNWGSLTKTTDAVGNVTTMTYDLLGRKKQLIDPDMGTWAYTVDNLGQVLAQTDNKNQGTTYAYDTLGRMTRRLEGDLDSRWYFDTNAAGTACNKSIGKLCEATTTNGYYRRNTYDNLGRLASQTSHIDADYVAQWGYDVAGRIDTQTFPATVGAFNAPLAIKYNYNASGLLQSVTNNAGSTAYWTRNAENADGNITSESYGNGLIGTRSYDPVMGWLKTLQAGPSGAPTSVQNHLYHYDVLGRLDQRQDNTTGVGTSETFGYDNLNRLTTANITGAGIGTQSTSVGFNAIGNITSKTGVGTYTYPPAGSVGPHAVSSVSGTVNGVANPSYGYDLNGNMLTDGAKSFTWTSFNMPATLTKAAQAGSPGAGTSTFLYGPEHQRLMQTWVDSAKTLTTIYLSEPHFEKEINSQTGLTEYKHYVRVGSNIVAIQTRRSNATEDIRFLIPDHLGSTSVVTDASGALTDRQAFDPWGDRRTASGTNAGAADPTNLIQPTSATRGYTGHEQLDQGNMGLTHMNGRVYDPTLGRFISADPTVQAPFSSQSFSRYSYVWNGPLNATDPSGYKTDWLWNAFAGPRGTIISGQENDMIGFQRSAEWELGYAMGKAWATGLELAESVSSGRGFKIAQTTGPFQIQLASNGTATSDAGSGGFWSSQEVTTTWKPQDGGGAEITGHLSSEPASGGWLSGPDYSLVSDRALSRAMLRSPAAQTEMVNRLEARGRVRHSMSGALSDLTAASTTFVRGPVGAGISLYRATKGRTGWQPGPNDLDFRGSGKNVRDALDTAFERTGLPRGEFEVTSWGRDANGKSFPAEWRHKSGAEVNVDLAHSKNGPDVPHVGYQTGGKRGDGGAIRGHILLDDVPFNR